MGFSSPLGKSGVEGSLRVIFSSSFVLEAIGVIQQNLEFPEEFQQFFNPQKFASLSAGDMFDAATPARSHNGPFQPETEHKRIGRWYRSAHSVQRVAERD